MYRQVKQNRFVKAGKHAFSFQLRFHLQLVSVFISAHHFLGFSRYDIGFKDFLPTSLIEELILSAIRCCVRRPSWDRRTLYSSSAFLNLESMRSPPCNESGRGAVAGRGRLDC